MNKPFNRQRRHNNNRSGRSVALQQITRFTIWDSSGPLGKLRGTALQLAEKYQAGAKDAQTQGDDVLLQTCQQYADHYLRLQNIAIENEQAKIKPVEQTAPENETEASVDTEPQKNEANEVENATTSQYVVVEKKPIIRHKKKEDNTLSMPMDALQEKSEITE